MGTGLPYVKGIHPNSGLLPVIECQTEDGSLYRVEYGFEGSKIVTRFHKQPPVDITKIGR